jgi:hypothetical protein
LSPLLFCAFAACKVQWFVSLLLLLRFFLILNSYESYFIVTLFDWNFPCYMINPTFLFPVIVPNEITSINQRHTRI